MATATREPAASMTIQGTMPDPREVRRVSGLLRQVADPNRLTILLLLASGDQHVGAMVAATGQGQPAISHHLALLRIGGIIEPRRQAKQNFYSLTETGLSLVETARSLFVESGESSGAPEAGS